MIRVHFLSTEQSNVVYIYYFTQQRSQRSDVSSNFISILYYKKNTELIPVCLIKQVNHPWSIHFHQHLMTTPLILNTHCSSYLHEFHALLPMVSSLSAAFFCGLVSAFSAAFFAAVHRWSGSRFSTLSIRIQTLTTLVDSLYLTTCSEYRCSANVLSSI